MEFNGFPTLRDYENACTEHGFQTRRIPFHKDGKSYFALVTTPPSHTAESDRYKSIESWHLFTADESEHVLEGIISGNDYLDKLAAHGCFPDASKDAPQPAASSDAAPAVDTSPAFPQKQAPCTPYCPIDEDTARRSHEMMSMRDYTSGSATAEYRAAVDKAAALVECQKQKVSPFYHDKLDALLDRYARRLADWTNAHNRNGASCPSILICGGSNFPTRKKEKQNTREDSLWKEYEEIQHILEKIQSIGTGAIDLTDPHARELLSERIALLQEEITTGKAMNAHYRKYKTMQGFPRLSEASAANLDDTIRRSPSFAQMPCPDFHLASLHGKLKTAQKRLDKLDNLQAAQKSPAPGIRFDGGEIVRNASENRLQILFDEMPDANTRARLKSRGFRWSPKNGAWQRILTRNAEYDARHILHIPASPTCSAAADTPPSSPSELPQPDFLINPDGQCLFRFVCAE